jgi:signal transduction histidine kinase/ActR/RegA family two-component response regulator
VERPASTDGFALLAPLIEVNEPWKDVATTCRRSLEALASTLPAARPAIYLADEAGALTAATGTSDPLGGAKPFGLPLHTSLSPQRFPASRDPRPGAAALLAGAGLEHVVSIPLLTRERFVGAVFLACRDSAALASLADGHLLTIGRAIASALDHARVFERSRLRSGVDGALLVAAKVAASSEDLEAVLEKHAEALAIVSRASRCGIALPDPIDERLLMLRAAFGTTPEELAAIGNMELSREAEVIKAAYETKRLAVADLSSSRTDATRRFLSCMGGASPRVAALPLVARDAVRGIAFLARSGDFDEEDRTLLEAVGHEVALAIESAAERETARLAREREALESQLRSAFRESRDIARMLTEAVERLGRALRVSRCFLVFDDRDEPAVARPRHEYRDPPELPPAVAWRFRRAGSAMQRAFEGSPEHVVCNDLERDARFAGRDAIAPADCRSFVAVRNVRGTSAGGGIFVGHVDRAHRWTDEEVRLVHAVGEHCALAIERADMRDEVRRRAEEFEFIVAQMTDGVCMCDENLEKVWMNAAGKEICWGSVQFDPAHFTVQGADARPLTMDELPLVRAVRGGERFDDLELLLRHTPTGDVRTIVCSGGPIHDGSGRLIGGTFVFRDVTEARAAAAHASRTEKLRVVGELAAGVAHELNNTLAAVLGRAELILGGTNEKETRRNAEVIAAAARDATHVLQRLTRVSHKTHATERRTRVDLLQVAADSIELTRPRWSRPTVPADREGRAIEVELAPHPPVLVLGVAAELREVLTNLILNAVDAMPAGGKIAITIAASELEAVVSVADTGCGMSAEVLRHAFEPFFTTKGEAGTGLGLNISSAIVAAHGGRIEARSTPGDGTQIRVLFPLFADDATPRKPVTTVPGPRRVLVVDDDPRVRALLADLLSADGHSVLSARSGEEALAQIDREREPLDLLVTDLSMPGMSGLVLAEELRGRHPRTAVVLVSGWTASASPEVLERLGASIVTKPFTGEDVRAAVAAALGRQAQILADP